MGFIQNKVALITGGASGIGFFYCLELLSHNLKGVTLADIDEKKGAEALAAIKEKFGPNRAIFVKTDVTNKEQFENAFKETIKAFEHVDILINNAGILNDQIWEREIETNLNGTIHGILLAFEEYIPKYKQGEEGVLVNISSIAGLGGFACTPIYASTKHAVIGLSRSYSSELHYDRCKIKVLTLCPGVTETPLFHDISGRNLGPQYQNILSQEVNILPKQKPISVAKAMVHIIEHGKTGSIWVSENDEPAYEIDLPQYPDLKKK